MDDRNEVREGVAEEEWKELTAERRAPVEGRGTPLNVIRHPIALPPMEPVKGEPWQRPAD